MEYTINGLDKLDSTERAIAVAIIEMYASVAANAINTSISILPPDTYGNGIDSLSVYRISDDWCLYVNDTDGAIVADVVFAETEAEDYLVDTYDMGDLDRHQFLSQWDLGCGPEAVADDYAGVVSIWYAPNYYAGTCNAPKANYVMDGDETVLAWSNAAAAQRWLDEQIGDGPYCCAHGEAGRPEYRIVEG